MTPRSLLCWCAVALLTPLSAPHVRAADLSVPNVSAFDVTDSGGTVHVVLGRPAGADESAGFELSYVRTDDGGVTWSPPVAVPTSHAPPARLHRGDDPRVAARGGHVMVLWTARGDGPFGSGPLACALSDDGGKTWRPGPAPSARALPVPKGGWKTTSAAAPKPAGRDSAPAPAEAAASGHVHGRAGHGADAAGGRPAASTGPGYRFPAAAAGDGAFHAVWIHAVGDERSLRHARLDFGADRWSDATVIDEKICACCWNEIKVAPDGAAYVLYRDQEPSDMSVASSRDGGATWQRIGHPGQFDWNFDGCPHVGGGLALAGDQVLASVWTGETKSAGAYVVSHAGGEWSRATALAAGGTLGRNTDIACLAPSAGGAAAVWDQLTSEGNQAIFVMTSDEAGTKWGAPRRLSSPDENAAYPRVTACAAHWLVVWTAYAPDGTTSLRGRTVEPPAAAGRPAPARAVAE
jgi:hypothetical protein